MSAFTDASSLIFFKCEEYRYHKSHIFDASSCPRPHYCMALILSGNGVFEDSDGGERVSVSEGDIIFVPMGSRYTVRWSGTDEIHYISMHFVFSSSEIFPQKNRYRFRRIEIKDFVKSKSIFADMLSFAKADDVKKLVLLGEFYSVLSDVQPYLSKKEEIATDSKLEKAIRYVENNYNKRITVEDLACAAQMSVSRFFPYFKRLLGLTPVDFINNQRIGHAIILLMNEESLTIEEIAEKVGFESSAYFRRVFKKITGRSPREYKKTSTEL